MSEYYAVTREGDDDHLEHLFGFGSRKGSQKANHKYVARVQVGNGWKYFYSTAELAAYKAGGAVKKAGNAVGGIAKKAGSAVGKVADGGYARVQSATNSKVREAEKKYKESKQMYNASKGVYKDKVDRSEKEKRLSKRLGKSSADTYKVDHAFEGRHIGERYRKMKSAEEAYNKARKDASPVAAVRRAANKATKRIDKMTGKVQKTELKSDAKRAAVAENRAASLERKMIKERDTKGFTKRFDDLRRAKTTASDNARDYNNKYNYRTSGKNNYVDYLSEFYDADRGLRRARKKKR